MGSTMRRSRVMMLATIIWLTAPRFAQAQQGTIVITGSATEHDRAIVRAAAEESTRDDGWSLAPKPPTKKETEALLGCDDSNAPWTCVPQSLHSIGIDHVLIVAVDTRQADNGAPMVVVSAKAIITDSHTSAGKQRHCTQCADDKLTGTATELIQELLRDIAVREGHTVIEVRSTPSQAQVVLDGRPVQATDASLNTYPGRHIVIIEKPGFRREIREVSVDRGKTAELTLVLTPAKKTPPIVVTTSPRPSGLVPGILAGVGVTAIAAGIILVAIDEDPSPTGGRRYWDTASAGVAIGAAGIVTAGVGAVLWRRASRARSTPAVAIINRGALLAWHGSF